LTASNKIETGAGIGDEPKARDVLTKGQRQNDRDDDDDSESDDFGLSSFSDEAGEAASQVDNINNSFSIAGAVAYNTFTHNVLATTGPMSELESDGDIAVTAETTQELLVKSVGTVISDGGDQASEDEDPATTPKKRRVRDKDKTFAAGLALSIGDFTNNVNATVQGGSRIDASGAVDVTSALSYPILADPFWVDPIAALPFGELARSTYEDGFDAETFFGTDFREELSNSMGPDMGLSESVNVWASSQVAGNGTDPDANPGGVEGGAKYTVAASIAIVNYDNHSAATIGDGALINQKPAFQTDAQNVNVDATINMQLVNVAGIMTVYAYAENVINVVKGKEKLKDTLSPIGNRAGVGGLGGSALLQTIDNETLATIGNGARVRAGADESVNVSATETMTSFNLVQAGGEAGKIGVSGSISVLNQDNTTIAKIDDNAIVSGGDIFVLADDETSHISIVGAMQTAGIAAVGISVSVNDVNRETLAIVGSQRDGLSAAAPSAGSALDIDATGDILVDAIVSGSLWSLGVAGTKVSKTKDKPADAKSPKPAGAKGKNSFTSGIGLAGDVTWNAIDDTTRASINSTGDVDAGGNLIVAAENETGIAAVSGAVAVVSAGGLALGLAGSFARNNLDLVTESWISGAGVNTAGDASVTADAASNVLAITAGITGSKSTRKTGASVGLAIAGSFSWNTIDGSTQAIVDHSDLLSGGDVTVQSTDVSEVLAVSTAVAATLAKTTTGAAVGIAAAGSGMINQLDRQIITEIRGVSNVTGGLDDADPLNTETGHVHVLAKDQSGIRSYAVGAALSLASGGAGTGVAVAVGISISENEIEGNTIARISSTGKITSDEEVRVVAEALGRAGDTLGGGLTAAQLDDAAKTDSDSDSVPSDPSNSINENTVDRTADELLKRTIYQQIFGTAAPIDQVLTLSQLGTETVAPVTETDESSLTDAQRTAREQQLAADEEAENQRDSQSDGSEKEDDANLVGTSWMFVDETAGKTYIIHKIGSELSVSETSITSVAVAASLAAAGGKNGLAAAGGGASTNNTILSEVLATVVGTEIEVALTAGDIVSSGDLDVIATSEQGIASTVVAAAASASKSGASGGALAIGAAVAENTIGDNNPANRFGSTRAIIDSTRTIIEHDVNVTAITSQRISTTVIAGSVAISGSSSTAVGLAGAGASVRNSIDADAEAIIRNIPAPTNETDHQFLARNVTVNAQNDSEINALAGAASLGIAIAGSNAVTISVAVGLAKNTITSQTLATIDNAHFEQVVDTGIEIDENVPAVHYLARDFVVNDVIVRANSSGSIDAIAFAAAMSASFGSTGIAVAGAGAEATNRINAKTLATIEDSRISATGDVDLDSIQSTAIHSFVLSAAVAIAGGSNAVGAAIGVSLARNLIGQANVAVTPNHNLSNRGITITQNQLVQISSGPGEGDVYRYLGTAAMSDPNPSAGENWLTRLDFNDREKWERADIAPETQDVNDPMTGTAVGSIFNNSAIIAGGDLTGDAEARSKIQSFVLAATVAASFGGNAAAVSGAGVGAYNEVTLNSKSSIHGQHTAPTVAGYIGADGAIIVTADAPEIHNFTGDDLPSYHTRSIALDTDDNTQIDSFAGAAAIAAAFGSNGLGLAIGVSLATNVINNSVDASIRDVTGGIYTTGYSTVTTVPDDQMIDGKSVRFFEHTIDEDYEGNISLSASENATIESVSVAAAVSLAFGSVGIALSGAGATATNEINNAVTSTIDNSVVTADGAMIFATEDLDANDLPKHVIALGDIMVMADAEAMRIEKVTGAVASISGGVVSASGGGLTIDNTIDNTVSAKISGDVIVQSNANVTVRANENAYIHADATAVTVAISLGAAIGVAEVTNNARSTIDATVDGAKIEGVDVLVRADSDVVIDRTTTAGVSASLIGVTTNFAYANISTTVNASVNDATINASNELSIIGDGDAYARTDAKGAAFGAIAVGVMKTAINRGVGIGADVTSTIDNGSQINAGRLIMSATNFDDLLARTIAAGGGVVSAAASDSTVTSGQGTLVKIGTGVVIHAGPVAITSSNIQNVDSSADAYSIGLATGTGAGTHNTLTGDANVDIVGGAEIYAENFSIGAANRAIKNGIGNGFNLQSGSVGFAAASILLSKTEIGTSGDPFDALVSISGGSLIEVDGGTSDNPGELEIESVVVADAFDRTRIEAVSGFSATYANSVIHSNTGANVNMTGASLINKRGDVNIATVHDVGLFPSSNLFSAGVSVLAGADADAIATADNSINVDNSTIRGAQVQLMSGRSNFQVPNLMSLSSNIDVTTASLGPSIAIGTPDASATYVNRVALTNNSAVEGFKDVVLVAEQNNDIPVRVETDGLVLSLSLIPYGYDVRGNTARNGTSEVTVSTGANASSVTAGIYNKSVMAIRSVAFDQQKIIEAASTSEPAPAGYTLDP